MKKLFALFSLFLLIGAGCLGTGGGNGTQSVQENLVSGDWWLVFDLPEGWTTYAYYQSGDSDLDSVEVTRDLTDVVVQSTAQPIAEDDDVSEGEEGFVTDDYTSIRVFRYDPRTSVPEDSEDLGNNFFKRVRDDGSVAYYLVGENGKYKFVVEQEGRDLTEAEGVILSAVEVTAL